jgi:hypothetical protein
MKKNKLVIVPSLSLIEGQIITISPYSNYVQIKIIANWTNEKLIINISSTKLDLFFKTIETPAFIKNTSKWGDIRRYFK